MDLYDMNHEEQMYTAIDFIERVIERAKTGMEPEFRNKFNYDFSLEEKFKFSVEKLDWDVFKQLLNEFISEVERK